MTNKFLFSITQDKFLSCNIIIIIIVYILFITNVGYNQIKNLLKYKLIHLIIYFFILNVGLYNVEAFFLYSLVYLSVMSGLSKTVKVEKFDNLENDFKNNYNNKNNPNVTEVGLKKWLNQSNDINNRKYNSEAINKINNLLTNEGRCHETDIIKFIRNLIGDHHKNYNLNDDPNFLYDKCDKKLQEISKCADESVYGHKYPNEINTIPVCAAAYGKLLDESNKIINLTDEHNNRMHSYTVDSIKEKWIKNVYDKLHSFEDIDNYASINNNNDLQKMNIAHENYLTHKKEWEIEQGKNIMRTIGCHRLRGEYKYGFWDDKSSSCVYKNS